MFTFGREHERKCAVAYVRNPAQAGLILRVIDAVHDLLESKAAPPTLARALRAAFIEGGNGVWETAATWLRKCSHDFPEVAELWLEFAQHSTSAVRFRAACCLNDVPPQLLPAVAEVLLADKSKKVAGMARERMNPDQPAHQGG